jgi:predicted ATPase/class 3 adenylate cyclase/tetratricopeptide (TPR) repeat protein
MPELPEGVITFVFTDVEGSTRLWEEAPDSMMEALNLHDEIIESVIAERGGVSVKPRGEGDSRFLVFPDAVEAVASIAEIQRSLTGAAWPTPRPIKVRASLLTGTAGLQLGDYYGSAVNRAARLRGIAHGGQTVLAGSTWELVQDALPAGVGVVDMGEHGLKDLTRPEHVYQLNVDGLPAEFPALKSLNAVANNLPQQLTEFVGREREVEEAQRLLAATRLLTVLAPGGTGKTRLGIQTAAELASDFPDGVFFVGLADIDSSGEIVQTIAEALGLGLSTDEDPLVQLLAYFSNKRQLLVLDNFEHVAEGASIISDILKAAPEIRVLATSRSKLGITGETVYPLAGLESSWETAEEALQTGGVQLFLDAARRAKPTFELTGDDLDGLARILRITGGSPLGILLAAAWVDMLPVVEIADEVERSLDFLETEMGDVPDRHRSVRAVFDYSWALLSEEERSMFAALSVFRGGFNREAAEAVAGASLRNLATLSSKSLITASPDTGRYAIHELLRAYAHAELESDAHRAQGVREAHADFYAAVMDEVTGLFFAADQVRAIRLIEADLDNIRSAFRHSVATGAPRSVRFVFGIHFIYECRGWYRAGVDLLSEVADALAESTDPDLVTTRCVAIAERAWFEALLGKPGEAAEAASSAVAALPETAGEIHRWLALQCYAICLAYVGWTDEMARLLEQGIEDYDSPSEPLWSAGLRNWRSFAAVVAEDFETVARLVPEAYAVLESIGDHYFMTWNLWLQALLAMGQGRAADAIELYERQVAVTEDIAYRRGRVVALEGLGDARSAAGQSEAAIAAFAEGMAAADKMGMVRDLLGMMTKIGRVKAGGDEQVEAVELLATVCAEPISAQQLFTAAIPIRDIAGEVLADLRLSLGDETYDAAHRRGAERPYEAVAKQLMDRFAG